MPGERNGSTHRQQGPPAQNDPAHRARRGRSRPGRGGLRGDHRLDPPLGAALADPHRGGGARPGGRDGGRLGDRGAGLRARDHQPHREPCRQDPSQAGMNMGSAPLTAEPPQGEMPQMNINKTINWDATAENIAKNLIKMNPEQQQNLMTQMASESPNLYQLVLDKFNKLLTGTPTQTEKIKAPSKNLKPGKKKDSL